jgi:GNAT superfamily N-acetyltransferase
MNIRYETGRPITAEQFVDVLKRSTLAERRPVGEPARIQAMLEHANLICTAWSGNELVGVARSLTDFEFCCYLSDLAVDEQYQKKGIGKGLIEATRLALGSKTKIILLSAPKAEGYYPKIGFEQHKSAWILAADQRLR